MTVLEVTVQLFASFIVITYAPALRPVNELLAWYVVPPSIEYSNVPVPPEADAVIDPFDCPKHASTGVADAVIAAGSPIVMFELPFTKHEETPSKTCTE